MGNFTGINCEYSLDPTGDIVRENVTNTNIFTSDLTNTGASTHTVQYSTSWHDWSGDISGDVTELPNIT